MIVFILTLSNAVAQYQYLLEAKPEKCSIQTPCVSVINATDVDLAFGKKRNRVPAMTMMWADTPYIYKARGIRLADGAVCRATSSLEVPQDHMYKVTFKPTELRCKVKD